MADLIFRVDGNLNIGFGHLQRCLKIAAYLSKIGLKSKFLTRDPINLSRLVSNGANDVIALDGLPNYNKYPWLGVSEEQDATDTIKFVKQFKIDSILHDNYGISDKWQSAMLQNDIKVIAIDDACNRKMLCEALFDPSPYRNSSDYARYIDDQSVYTGQEYNMVSPHFFRTNLTKINNNIYVNFGGADRNNLCDSAIEILRCESGYTFEVVTPVHRYSQLVEKYSASSNINFHTNLKPIMLSKLQKNCMFSVGAGGVNAIERVASNLPSLVFLQAENQRENIHWLTTNNLAVLADFQNLKTKFKETARAENIMQISENCNQKLYKSGLEKMAEKINAIL